jgi:pimeloyl-ACP methyl ester carboxylesterase
MKQLMKYKSGNLLSYSEYGDKNGYPILVQHGMIASITDYHLFDRLIETGTHLISIARPGYGESSPYHMSNMAEWGDIVSVLVDDVNSGIRCPQNRGIRCPQNRGIRSPLLSK